MSETGFFLPLSPPGVECAVNQKGSEIASLMRTPDRTACFAVPFLLGIRGGFVLF